jgi:hypothetical protein
MSWYSDRLCSFPWLDFMTGVGSCLSIGGNYYGHDISWFSQHADESAIQSDWKAVGKDLYSALSLSPISPFIRK